MVEVSIREFHVQDDLVELTHLIHAAYAQHAASGRKYWATHQSVEDTASRFASGLGYLVEIEEKVCGTVILRPPQPDSEVEFYRQQGVWTLSQFCIDPKFQGQGLGKKLHQFVLEEAKQRGATHLALDTAESASGLIQTYQDWGYRIVGNWDWRPKTNYLSVIMARPI
ncbi:GNAT family N-acetyltransferase [bacterium (Candidatus Blackallbacteria) CG17_big_fil_post_rev_8_21_14_2_50_48_46]|uniref:GNAT family N-acetyltransferase n=1 Tax=bacterium (Candidatus Blackallbacteria) CG17_big_fil_post_rev_8_21_14_2_50_48_46 TaxID=2014261 RepID=A0A2M7G5G0_9BACT|nr:MAG: GNAT family N-acetyltransferase [bacterium (Candidatus Blackallbacteria) CG18_big_fil_WC_8_21_14_2_50_49_26]PIW17208.1 MAG: GNAT family N-acetyltransferase [bacterium (Candidatus Blackallbacteria) CG17_big_fil_post_rev_8_21_14_2_50_48_46]PIW50999.1 MAG: GNAT family N-acetyltransferase [bacterium (Candidatus Blackallbacteria) CG13_big_fil_rev_8_21_14_2_50_49_14]